MSENENEGKYLEDMLEDSLAKLIEEMDEMQPGSDEHVATARVFCDMYKTWIESNKVELEYNDRREQRAIDVAMDDKKAIENRNQELIKTGVQVLLGVTSIAAPLAFYGVWMSRGFKFEETGTFTSNTFKGFFRNFRPNKI